ncbi:FixH family protein [Ramlibacter sp.]|uniref:FixH family protein n=1 Tax=Ramlibacter sp. TaxID=1917967 RepID=UPI002FC764C1
MQQQIPTTSPWWRFPFVWLVIAGPAAVVVAGFVTAFIAVSGADPVVATDYYRRGMEINKTLAAGSKASLPAMQGRNHAATPTAP